MNNLRAGELCAGYNGLGMAIEAVFGATPAWFSEFDPAPSKILAYHYPNVPNYGDMTAIDWAAIEPVDIISGGTPCQDLSHAGKRAGMTEGTRSNLWVQMRESIAVQRPKFVVWENVRGSFSAEADSDLEQCPGCVGDPTDGRVFLRALGRVLGDLADLGYDAEWRGLRAADVGACHPRYRVFVLAFDPRRVGREEALEHYGRRPQAHNRASFPDQSNRLALRPGPLGASAIEDADVATGCERGIAAPGQTESWRPRTDAGGRDRAPTTEPVIDWGEYAEAIARQESVMGRRAPAPTEPTGRDGNQRLSPRFTEWMMGLPDGWVTDPAIGISRNDQLKACGNGVVPQQAASALRDMLGSIAARQPALMAAA
jgi:DNA (cytosine-5)-methyltransferase 1